MPPKTLQTVLGHGNITTTMNNYVNPKPIDIQLEQMNAIARECENVDELGNS